MNDGTVDYITFSGDRRRYFRVNTKGFKENFIQKVKAVTVLRDLLQEVLKERSDSKHLDFNEELKEMVKFQAYITDKISEMIDNQKKNNPD